MISLSNDYLYNDIFITKTRQKHIHKNNRLTWTVGVILDARFGTGDNLPSFVGQVAEVVNGCPVKDERINKRRASWKKNECWAISKTENLESSSNVEQIGRGRRQVKTRCYFVSSTCIFLKRSLQRLTVSTTLTICRDLKGETESYPGMALWTLPARTRKCIQSVTSLWERNKESEIEE